MQGLQLLESAIRNMDGAAKPDSGAPDAPESRAFLEALLETDALKDSGLTLEDLEAWLASQGGKGMPLGGQELPLGDMGDGKGAQGELAQAQQLLQRADAAADTERSHSHGSAVLATAQQKYESHLLPSNCQSIFTFGRSARWSVRLHYESGPDEERQYL